MTLEWLWRQLKDGCTRKGCKRLGVRGNENVINGRLVCDDCDAREIKKRRAKSKAPSRG